MFQMSKNIFCCDRYSLILLINKFSSLFISKMPYYAVANGRSVGVFSTWSECENQVKGFKGAKFKKFNTMPEANSYVSGISNNHIASNLPTSSTSVPPVSRKSSNKTSSVPNYITGSVRQSSSGFRSTACSKAPYSNKSCSESPPSNKKEINEFEDIDDIHDALMRKMDQIENDIGEIKEKVTKRPNRSKKAIMIDALPNIESSPLKRPGETSTAVDSKKARTCFTQGMNSYKFDVDDVGFVEVYTDGSCTNNGSSKARAGLGVYFGENHPLNVSEPVSGRATNNCGEIQAATKAIHIAHSLGINKLAIKTDSQFVINSITKWIGGWKKKGWKLASGEPVKNEIDFKALDEATKLLAVKWTYVNAHKGILGNERADQLAKEGAAKYNRR